MFRGFRRFRAVIFDIGRCCLRFCTGSAASYQAFAALNPLNLLNLLNFFKHFRRRCQNFRLRFVGIFCKILDELAG